MNVPIFKDLGAKAFANLMKMSSCLHCIRQRKDWILPSPAGSLLVEIDT